jgi:hypothetical protein
MNSQKMKMTTKNKYGLARYVPADIRRIVRKRCGFGCVVCAKSIYNYHHFDVEYCNAKEHDPEKMMLLCYQCHGKIGKQLSHKTVMACYGNPAALQKGFSHEFFDICSPFTLQLADNCFMGFTSIIRESTGEEWLTMKSGHEDGPASISAKFYNVNGIVDLEIDDNELKCYTNTWDIQFQGRTLSVHNCKDQRTLKLLTFPPNRIYVEQLFMNKGNVLLKINKKGLLLKLGSFTLDMNGSGGTNSDAVIQLP